MLRDDFEYDGPNDGMGELVQTVNQIAKLLNNAVVDLGSNGGTDLAPILTDGDRLVIDLTRLYIEPPPP